MISEKEKNERNKPKEAVKKEKPSLTLAKVYNRRLQACRQEYLPGDQTLKQESLILAQDERWRRA